MVPDVKNNRLQLSLRDTSSHEMGKDQKSQDTTAPYQDQVIETAPPAQTPPRSSAMNTRQFSSRLPRLEMYWGSSSKKNWRMPHRCGRG